MIFSSIENENGYVCLCLKWKKQTAETFYIVSQCHIQLKICIKSTVEKKKGEKNQHCLYVIEGENRKIFHVIVCEIDAS